MKVAIVHHRIGGLDGVSLEIAKRRRVLESLGHQVILISGPNQQGADYVLPDLAIPPPHRRQRPTRLQTALAAIQQRERFQFLFVHNIFSLGRHPQAARDILAFLDRWQGKTVAVNHDFYWEQPFGRQLTRQQRQALLPRRPYLRHVVINSLAARQLWRRRQLKATIIGDVFDFSQSLGNPDHARRLRRRLGLSQALIILQATRIVPRKGIELGIDFAAALQKRLRRQVVFFLLNYPDAAVPESRRYFQALRQHARRQGVTLIAGFRYLGANFSFWDGYHLADLVSYPSLWEGYGNQFLEAVFFQKPILVFEYPVFRADIRPHGYQVLSLGSRHYPNHGLRQVPQQRLEAAVSQYLRWQQTGQLAAIAKANQQIARRYNSLARLRRHLQKILRWD